MADEVKFSNVIVSAFGAETAKSAANKAALAVLMGAVAAGESEIRLGGGKKAAEAQRAKGRLTARERIALLLDEGTELMELGLWAAFGMYAEYGGAPGAGVVAGGGCMGGCA